MNIAVVGIRLNLVQSAVLSSSTSSIVSTTAVSLSRTSTFSNIVAHAIQLSLCRKLGENRGIKRKRRNANARQLTKNKMIWNIADGAMIQCIVLPHHQATTNRPLSQLTVLHPSTKLFLHGAVYLFNPTIGWRVTWGSSDHPTLVPQLPHLSYDLRQFQVC
jgi:hypothetical protein